MAKMSLPTEEERRRQAFAAMLYQTLREWMRARNLLPEREVFDEMVGVILNMRDLFHGEASDKQEMLEQILLQHKVEVAEIAVPAPIMFCLECPHRPGAAP